MSELNLSNSVASFDVAKHNAIVKRWAPKVKRQLKNSTMVRFSQGKRTSFVLRKGRTEGKLSESVKARIGKKLGVSELVSFSFERHGIFVHKGVGKGYEMQGGVVVRTTKAATGLTRNPVSWFNPILEKYIPLLANEIAVVNANAALNAVKMHIK